jgi:AcrR family transcriptional regulator
MVSKQLGVQPTRSQQGRRVQGGQVTGAKGFQTRRRLISATENLLKTRSLRDLRVADIARAAKTSPSNFYVHFEDVPEAVLAVIGEISRNPPSFLALVGEPWEEIDAYERAQHFVEAYFDYWQAHSDLFRVRNLAADEGDLRFVQARVDAVSPLLQAMTSRIEERKAAGALAADIHPMSTAGALLAMIERIAAAPSPTGGHGMTRDRVVHATAFFAAMVLGGRASVGDVANSSNNRNI